jgi:methylglutaconyl-CoA hydratase
MTHQLQIVSAVPPFIADLGDVFQRHITEVQWDFKKCFLGHDSDKAQWVLEITLNRPEVHNAFNPLMIKTLIQLAQSCQKFFANSHPDCDLWRAIVLKGAGKSFSAGADLEWMKSSLNMSEAENKKDSHELSSLFSRFNELPIPLISLVHGAVMGGGVGLVAVSDFVLAHPETKFALSEVKLGLIPAVISPYVIQKMGAASCRRYMLTGEFFSTQSAQSFHLVNESHEDFEQFLPELLERFLLVAPRAQRQAKSLIHMVASDTFQENLPSLLVEKIASIRAGEEAIHGMTSLLTKQKARWQLASVGTKK